MNVKKIKAAMVEAGFSQRKLAEEMNMSKNTLNAKINGRARIFVDEALKLCVLLNIPQENVAEIFLP